MSTIVICLPDALKALVSEESWARGYGTASGRARELIREGKVAGRRVGPIPP